MSYFKSIIITTIIFLAGAAGCASSQPGDVITHSDSLSIIPKFEPTTERSQPVVAVVGENTFTELTDYVVPFGILKQANVGEVHALSTQEGPMQMFPALKIQPQNTIHHFDELYPEGADYVVVPAVHHNDDPDLLEWLVQQAEKGATVVGICDGVWVLANAGLLEGKRAVAHWYSFKKLEKKFPGTEWIRNSRYLADRNVITTTGVTASIPVSLALVEAIAGTEQASEVAGELGVSDWSAEHNSSDFKLKSGSVFTALKNKIAFWSHEKIGVPVYDDIDEIGLALLADAYSRTYRSKAYSVSPSEEEIVTQHGLTILPDQTEGVTSKMDRTLAPLNSADLPSAHVLDITLQDIAKTYGRRTASFVALQLEYPQLKEQ